MYFVEPKSQHGEFNMKKLQNGAVQKTKMVTYRAKHNTPSVAIWDKQEGALCLKKGSFTHTNAVTATPCSHLHSESQQHSPCKERCFS
jgi:hypothetical protein